MSKANPWFTILTLFLQTLYLGIVNTYLYTNHNVNQFKTFLICSNFIICGLSLMVIISIKQVFKNYRTQMEVDLLKGHVSEINNLVSVLNKERFEYTQSIKIIHTLLYLNNPDKARTYADRIVDRFSHVQDTAVVHGLALESLLTSRKKLAESREIDFQFNIACNLNYTRFRTGDICSIISNLLDNALESALIGSHPRKVSLEIKIEAGWLLIYVQNSGDIIKAKYKACLFEPGFTTKRSPGRGYGLYAVRQIVDSYGGAIDVKSDKITTFIIYLPVEEVIKHGKSSIG
ncbi:sensor histidine kinase [Syntrophomonas palmitatica]|uniref:sensor histidine kinase n=1 Tax=Syntrophomonas palmitatica TaxID=402877 RepID=UPI0006CF7DA9|nr:ATP-binding protein [Syntrophomonas palmitatica]